MKRDDCLRILGNRGNGRPKKGTGLSAYLLGVRSRMCKSVIKLGTPSLCATLKSIWDSFMQLGFVQLNLQLVVQEGIPFQSLLDAWERSVQISCITEAQKTIACRED